MPISTTPITFNLPNFYSGGTDDPKVRYIKEYLDAYGIHYPNCQINGPFASITNFNNQKTSTEYIIFKLEGNKVLFYIDESDNELIKVVWFFTDWSSSSLTTQVVNDRIQRMMDFFEIIGVETEAQQ